MLSKRKSSRCCECRKEIAFREPIFWKARFRPICFQCGRSDPDGTEFRLPEIAAVTKKLAQNIRTPI